MILFFDGLSDEELKATEVLEASKEEVIKIVANNTFIIKEIEDNAEKRQAIVLAKILLNMKLPIEQIVLATGLTEE